MDRVAEAPAGRHRQEAPAAVPSRPASHALEIRRGPQLNVPPERRARNLVAHVWRTVESSPDREAVRWKAHPARDASDRRNGSWRSHSYGDLGELVVAHAVALKRAGVKAGSRVAIISGSRPEWLVADLASLSLGAVTCPIHPAEAPAQVAFMLRNVGARLALVEGRHLARLREPIAASGCVDRVLVLDEEAGPRPGVQRLADLAPTTVSERWRAAWRRGWGRIGRDELATIVHTSGTTGVPKGVMLTHGNILHNCEAAVQAIPFSTDDVGLTILPLSHMYARSAGMFVPLGIGAAVAFAEPVMERWGSNLEEVAPTVMLTVPPFFQRIHRRILSDVERQPAYRRALFAWAVGLGTRRYATHLAGRRESPLLGAELWLANRFVFRQIHRRTGGRLRFFACGGAPLPRDIGELFYAMGMLILEGYGLSECAPFLTLNLPASFRFGSVGFPFAETEIAVDRETGEVLARGPQIMRGYVGLPEETAEAIDAEGWFHTGDIGEFDDVGRLLITDRLKNLIVLANGKKVMPGPMEAALLGSPYLAQAVLVGDGREATVALVAPNATAVLDWAKGRHLTVGDRAAMAAEPVVRELIDGEVRRLLAGFAAYERPRRVIFLPRDLTEEDGELTALGKPRRKAVMEHWGGLLAAAEGSGA